MDMSTDKGYNDLRRQESIRSERYAHSTAFPFFLDILIVILYNVKDDATIIIFHTEILTIFIKLPLKHSFKHFYNKLYTRF
jgi:hypothetical protein